MGTKMKNETKILLKGKWTLETLSTGEELSPGTLVSIKRNTHRIPLVRIVDSSLLSEKSLKLERIGGITYSDGDHREYEHSDSPYWWSYTPEEFVIGMVHSTLFLRRPEMTPIEEWELPYVNGANVFIVFLHKEGFSDGGHYLVPSELLWKVSEKK